jgi:ribonuclease HI
MELRAVTEMLSILPEWMHVWVSTDSAYVKMGITEWMGNWIANKWRTRQNAPVANKELWQQLITAAARHTRIEWS